MVKNRSLEAQIEKLMVKKFGFKRGSYRLLMSTPISKVFGNSVDDPQAVAEEIFTKILEDGTISREITEYGLDHTCAFLSSSGYHRIREILLGAAEKVREEILVNVS